MADFKKRSSVAEALDPFAKAASGRPSATRPVAWKAAADVPSPLELGRRFRKLRVREGLSLRAAADRVGTNPTTLSRFEREGRVSGELLLRLLRLMSSASGFSDAFLTPKFRDIGHVKEHIRRSKQ